MQETQVWSLGWKDPLQKEMATHCCSLPWEILWTEDVSGLSFMESQKSLTWLSNYTTTTTQCLSWHDKLIYIFWINNSDQFGGWGRMDSCRREQEKKKIKQKYYKTFCVELFCVRANKIIKECFLEYFSHITKWF